MDTLNFPRGPVCINLENFYDYLKSIWLPRTLTDQRRPLVEGIWEVWTYNSLRCSFGAIAPSWDPMSVLDSQVRGIILRSWRWAMASYSRTPMLVCTLLWADIHWRVWAALVVFSTPKLPIFCLGSHVSEPFQCPRRWHYWALAFWDVPAFPK